MLIPLKTLVDKYNVHPKGVLHVGANVGEEAIQYEQQGIKNVVWIEANPDIFKTLVSNVEKYGHRCFNFCAGHENTESVKLHVANNNGQSSSVLELGTHSRNHPNVKYTHDVDVSMCRIEDFPGSKELEGLDFLSMDIQGFELQALKGMGDLLKQFKWVYLEVNTNQVYKGNAELSEITKYLGSFGFKQKAIQMTKFAWGDALFSRY